MDTLLRIYEEIEKLYDAKDSLYDRQGRKHVDHIKDHGTFEDFPWDWAWTYVVKFVESLGVDLEELLQTGQRIREGKSQRGG